MFDFSEVFRGQFYSIDARGRFQYTEAGDKAYRPLLSRISMTPEQITSLEEHRRALALLKNTATLANAKPASRPAKRRVKSVT